ncbi:MAG: formylmethionine deformylase [Candidatus Levybacteria bacterium GW2011_GWC1_40_19]|nr:MAG: formylmethionine deformylase [Candidatus Levybacteria bacterium GW2011_GWA1_39_32]KKR50131.1 MAG: formylmethionine deformylase [Candidatus Levybacteria bacterium GW2011_GWC1_40_19]KKR73132.1 MAG: formylmethionine deformylase [Candidatus Levybacteria bacterium GW2011_GWC2_40_7]KKR94978.1 MAG: formylmethionine deformylase [Candidatus Levybacteria bacterium GW2011_GWA2_41_15]KKS00293.1 MAG: formylmethionine deformylase [Candidatus Levybacteria bacterium GW2011_GWB1_41_21]HBB76710.1 peptid
MPLARDIIAAMAILKVIRLGHPALRTKSKEVDRKELSTKFFQKFLDDLAKTCVKNSGAGIAAPQVGKNKRVIVVHVDPKNPRYPNKKPFPLTIVVNPKVLKKSKITKEDWEGDLSVGIRALVPRSKTCIVTGLDRLGKPVTYRLDYGFHARVFQHEIDHLNGIFFIDRVKRKETLSELKEWKRYWKNKKMLRSRLK